MRMGRPALLTSLLMEHRRVLSSRAALRARSHALPTVLCARSTKIRIRDRATSFVIPAMERAVSDCRSVNSVRSERPRLAKVTDMLFKLRTRVLNFFTDADPLISVGSIIATPPGHYVWRCHVVDHHAASPLMP